MATTLVPDCAEVPEWSANINAYIEVMGYLGQRCPEAMAAMEFTDRAGAPYPYGFSGNSWQHADGAAATRLADSLALALRTEQCGFFPHLPSRDAKILWDKLRTLERFLAACGGFSVA